jgi:hypothetical protein
MIRTKKILSGGLNTDDAYSVFPAEDYQNAENISIVSDADGKIASIKNVWGDQKITNIFTPTFGENAKCIGTFSDRENMRVFYFVYRPDANDLVLCLDLKDNTIKKVLEGDFGFRPEREYRINCSSLVGDQLYWTDHYNQPRKINVERGLKTYNPAYETDLPPYTSIRLQDITIIKEPPVLPLGVEKIVSAEDDNVPDQVNNFIADNSFQFAYRFIYKDNEISVLSPYSKLVNYNNDDSEVDFDTVKINIPKSQLIFDEVNIVQILSRSGNAGVWSIVKELKRDDFQDQFDLHNTAGEDSYSFYFFNDVAGIVISDEDAYRSFDQVPLKSKTLESARNRLFLGNNTLGYSATNTELSAELVDQSIGEGAGNSGVYYHFSFYCVEGDLIPSAFYDWVVAYVPDYGYYLSEENYELFDLVGLSPTLFVSDDNKVGDAGDSFEQVLTFLINRYVDINLNCDPVNSTRGIPNLATGDRVYNGADVLIYGLGDPTEIQTGDKQFKCGSKYQFGLVFYDEYLRNSGVLTNDSCIVRTEERKFFETNYKVSIKWTLGETPIPEWARYYSIVRTKNMNISTFLQHYTEAMKYVSKDDDGNYVFENTYDQDNTIGLAINISRIANDGFGYQFIEGDLVKLFFSDNTTVKSYPLADQFGPYVITGEVDDLGQMNDVTNFLRKAIYEIHTPKRSSLDEFFYEVGDFYLIDNPGTDLRSFSITEGLTFGDVYLKERPFDEAAPAGDKFVQEVMNPNDNYWSEWLQDTGRANIILFNSGQEERITNIAYSNTYIQGTMVNGLSRFDLLDYRDLDEQNGAIQKLVNTSRTQEYGSVLLAICTVETSSIYLGETRIVDNAGTALLSTSGEVIGTINNLKGGYGTTYPESVAENEGNVYYFDNLQGQVIRYSQNGLEPISDAKMTNWFKDYGRLERTVGITGGSIVGGFDARTDEYLLYLPSINGVSEPYLVDQNEFDWHKLKKNDNKTLAFSKKYSRWTTTYTYQSECFAEVGNILVRFLNGQAFIFTNNNYNTFDGVFYPSRVSVVLNENPMVIKEMRGIGIEGERPYFVHIQNKRPNLQSSDLYSSEFSGKEGVHYSPVLRDRLTPSADDYEAGLLKGDYIRGQFIEVMFQWGQRNSQIEINFLDFMYSISSGHSSLLTQ